MTESPNEDDDHRRRKERIRRARVAAETTAPESMDSLGESFESDDDPSQIGDYRIRGKPIGRGSFAVVYCAERPGSPVLYAIKLQRRQFIGDSDVAERFAREAFIGRSCSGLGLLNVLDSGTYECRHFLVTQFVDGLDLQKRIDSAPLPLPLPDAVRIGHRLTQAAAVLHSKSIIHRDIKPSNILVNNEDDVFLIDLGLAKDLTSQTVLTELGNAVGTLDYMPPEAYDHRYGKITCRADVFAIGVTLYQLLTKTLPFPEAVVVDGKKRLRTFHSTRLRFSTRRGRRIPRPVIDICLGCLELLAEDRYHDAAEVASDFERYLSDEPIEKRRISYWKRIQNAWRVRPLYASVITSAIAAIVVPVVLLLQNIASQRAERVAAEYIAGMREIERLWDDRQTDGIARLLKKHRRDGPDDHQAFEWRYWKRLVSPKQVIMATPNKTTSWCRPVFDAQGHRLAVIDRNGIVTLLDANTGNELVVFPGACRDIAFSADGRRCVTLRLEPAGGADIREVENGRIIRTFGEGEQFTAVAIHYSGRWVVTGSFDGKLRSWDLDSENSATLPHRAEREEGSVVRRRRVIDAAGLSPPKNNQSVSNGSQSILPGLPAVTSLAFAMNDDSPSAGYSDGVVCHFGTAAIQGAFEMPPDDVHGASGKQWKDFPVQAPFTSSRSHTGPVTGIAFHPWRYQVATQSSSFRSGDSEDPCGVVRVSSMVTLESLFTLIPQRVALQSSESQLTTGSKLSPQDRLVPAFDGSGLIYVAASSGVEIWNPDSGHILETLDTAGQPVVGLDYSPRSGLLAAVLADGSAMIWMTREFFPETVLNAAEGSFGRLALSQETNEIGVVYEPFDPFAGKSCLLSVFDAESGADKVLMEIQYPAITAPQYLRRHRDWLCSGRTLVPHEFSEEEPLSGETAEDPPGSPDREPEFSSDDSEVLMSDSGNIVIRLARDASHSASFENIATSGVGPLAHSAPIGFAAISSNERVIATGDSSGTLRLWDGRTGAMIRECNLENALTAGAFDHDGIRFSIGTIAGSVHVLDIDNGRIHEMRSGHGEEVTGVSFLPSQNRLVSCSGGLTNASHREGEVFIWDLETGSRCATLSTLRPSSFGGVAVSHDASAIYATANSVGAERVCSVMVWRCTVAVE